MSTTTAEKTAGSGQCELVAVLQRKDAYGNGKENIKNKGVKQ